MGECVKSASTVSAPLPTTLNLNLGIVPIPTLPMLSIIIRTWLLVLNHKPTLSVVPIKLVLVLVPALPFTRQYNPAALLGFCVSAWANS